MKAVLCHQRRIGEALVAVADGSRAGLRLPGADDGWSSTGQRRLAAGRSVESGRRRRGRFGAGVRAYVPCGAKAAADAGQLTVGGVAVEAGRALSREGAVDVLAVLLIADVGDDLVVVL